MNEELKKWLKPALFVLGGVLVGYLYYRFVGCASGTCAIASNPWMSMGYMGLVGWLLSGVLWKGCCSPCNHHQ